MKYLDYCYLCINNRKASELSENPECSNCIQLTVISMRGMKIMIAIKGMDMPANCGECPLTYPVGFYRNLPFSVDKSKGCCILVCEIEDPNIRLIDCPLIEIKEHEEK